MNWQAAALLLYGLMSLIVMVGSFSPYKRRTDAEIARREALRAHPAYGFFVLIASLLSPLLFCWILAAVVRDIRKDGRE